MFRGQLDWKGGAVLLLLPLTLVAVVEAGLALIRHVPIVQRDGPLLQTARLIYLSHRTTIQYLPECARYDPATTYLLRPGECEFSADEFNTTIRVNRLGLRDDPESLVQPEMVVLGDSYAMGWGVQQEETFPSLIEAATGLRVLNAAISSYGTARELALLSRIDRSAMRYLVIQYAGNDYPENVSYLQGGGRLGIMPEESYDEMVRLHETRRTYYPGMYLLTWIDAWQQGMTVGRPGVGGSAGSTVAPVEGGAVDPRSLEEAEVFLKVLAKSPVPLDGVEIIVLTIACPADFVEALHRQIEATKPAAPINSLRASHLEFLLSTEDYFHLDDHLLPRGHARIAEHLRELLDL